MESNLRGSCCLPLRPPGGPGGFVPESAVHRQEKPDPGGKTEAMFIVEAWGSRVRVVADQPGWLEEVRSFFLPGWREVPEAPEATLLQIRQGGAPGEVLLTWEDELSGTARTREERLRFMENWLHLGLAARSPQALFLHAGAVVHRGHGIVLPGSTHAGKSTLVHALVEAGATYYSDEFAVLDPEGRLHPHPVALNLRGTGSLGVQDLGGPVDLSPVPVGLVLLARHEPGRSQDAFEEVPPGEALLECLQHAVNARAFPALALRCLAPLATGTRFLRGPRGEAPATARSLLA